MKAFFTWAKDTLFHDSLDFRAHIFNTLAILGFFLACGLGFYYIFHFSGPGNIIGNFAAAALAVIFIVTANYTKAFRLFFLLTVIILFLIIFPVLFFAGGGYHSSMPCFFVFALVFTAMMLEGRLRTIFTLVEFALYFACFMTAYFYPQTVKHFPTEADIMRDIVIGCLACSAVLAIAMHRHMVIYDRKMRELEKANAALKGINRMKSEFLQDIKHEIRNPLHIISLGTDSAHAHIEAGDTPAAHNVLNSVQNEAIRLGRMINGMVQLATISGGQGSRAKVDLAAMLQACAEAFRLRMAENHTALRLEIAPGLPFVYAEAEQLARVPVNLLSNAMDSARGGEIVLSACADAKNITVRVSDTGGGIAPELLPHVFERGVSGKGGEGYGLSICKTIVEAHGGSIEIASEQGQGATVIFRLPIYGGQSEERRHEG